MALQTKTFTAGGTSATRNYSIHLKLTEESTSVSGNTSVVSYEFSIHRQNYGIYTGPYYNWDISIAGKTIAIRKFAFNIPTSGASSQVITSGQITVGHNADGSISMPFDVHTPSAQDLSPNYGPPEIRLTGSWPLTTIPRASTVIMSSASVNIEDLVIIGIYSNSSTFTHKLVYTCGTIRDEVLYENLPGNTQNYAWTIPGKIYQQIPNAKSISCTVTCYTYSGGVEIGTSQTSCMLVAAEERCRPAVSGTVASVDALSATLTGGTDKLIRYVSTARAAILATAKNSASISGRTVNGQALTDILDFPKVETGQFVFAATDSRGFSASATVQRELVPYVPLTLNPLVSRKTPTGDTVILDVKGNFWQGNFGAADNTLTLSYQYRTESGEWSESFPLTGAIPAGNAYTASTEISDMDYRQSYVFRLTATDKTGTLTQEVSLPQGIPVVDWGRDDFNFNVPIKVKNVPLPELVYPVGSIYMSMADTDPGSLFGGVWERIQGRFLLGAGTASENSQNIWGSANKEAVWPAGETGGTPAHTLTVAEMPSHTHGFDPGYAKGGKTFTVPSAEGNGGTGITPNSSGWGEPMSTPADWVTNVWGTTPAGGGVNHTNMPPYLVVYMWRRIG